MTWSALPFFYLQNIASRLLGSRHGTAVRPLYIEDPANAGFLSQSRFVSLDINSPAPSLLFRVHSPLGRSVAASPVYRHPHAVKSFGGVPLAAGFFYCNQLLTA